MSLAFGKRDPLPKLYIALDTDLFVGDYEAKRPCLDEDINKNLILSDL